MGYDPRPRDPRRLHLTNDISAGYDERGLLRITVAYHYDEWCCDGAHEVADAVIGISEILDEAQDRIARAERDEMRRDLGLD